MFYKSLFFKVMAITLLTNSKCQNSPDVEFRFYSNDNSTGVPTSPEDLGNNYNPENTYIILFHGSHGKGDFNGDFYPRATKKFLMLPNHNVIAGGYFNMLRNDSSNTEEIISKVSESYGKLLVALTTKNINADKFVLVGHCLGSHIAGVAAKYVTESIKRTVRKIYAIDPDVVDFKQEHVLHKQDAQEVSVIHTSKRGIQDAIGHTDFYPNGGLDQSACQIYIDYDDHNMGIYYFICSIIGDCFNYGRKCENFNLYSDGKCNQTPQGLMGYNNDVIEPGKYYLMSTCLELQGHISSW